MTTKIEKAEQAERDSELLEIRLSLLKKEPVTDEDGKALKDDTGAPVERHTQHTSFEITDQALCHAISDLLADAITKEHMEDVPKYPDGHAKAGDPILDAHKFALTGKPPEKKKKPAA